MTAQQIYQQFISDVQHFSWLEFISTITQIASVWYARKNNVLVYPTGIIGVIIASYVCFTSQLYADAGLNIYYFIMSVYGWYNWVLKRNGNYEYPISWCNKKELKIGLIFFVAGWGILYWALKNYTNSNVPVLDSFVSASAVTGMWWMAKRKIENWIAWIVSDVVAIPLFFYKHLMLFTVMYFLFLILAIAGYIEWIKKYRSARA
ncbi:MAG: nicotinamide riboside transporter PnuC [Chitinophagaceae bacterium]